MMMKQALITVIVCVLFSTSYAQKRDKIKGSRNVTISQTNINSFNRIIVGEDFKIDLIEGQQASVFVEADDNLQDVVKYNVADSTLSFQTTKNITTFKKLNIKVTYTRTLKQIETIDNGEVSSLTSIDLDEVTLTHSGSSRAYLNIKSPKFKLTNNDRSKLKLNVKTSLATLELNDNSKIEALIEGESLEVDIYQRANAKIEGGLQKMELRADNTSIFNGRNLVVANAEISGDLNCNIYINVTDAVSIGAKGNSEVFIYNNPAITLTAFEGTSKLHKKELKK
ncbi:MAG: DUF2807 domain-containing protein [Flavobacteriaceae bacterium]|nr:DUF2807 domain-containing protein [Flavobacteriaceae bacterium]